MKPKTTRKLLSITLIAQNLSLVGGFVLLRDQPELLAIGIGSTIMTDLLAYLGYKMLDYLEDNYYENEAEF